MPLTNAHPEMERTLQFFPVENQAPRKLSREQISQLNEVPPRS